MDRVASMSPEELNATAGILGIKYPRVLNKDELAAKIEKETADFLALFKSKRLA